jgi:DNA repair ATPase RecN
MIKSILKLALLLIVGIVVYNLFMGTPEEKTGAKKIVKEVKDVGVEIGNLLKEEKKKFDQGKYDNALDKIDDLFEDLKNKAEDIDKKYLPEIETLEEKANDLKERIDKANKHKSVSNQGEKELKELNKQFENLVDDVDDLLEKMKSN